MQIVTDAAADMVADLQNLPIHIVPLSFTIDGTTYRNGIDIDTPGFYHLLARAKDYPTTAQPAPGEVAELYRKVAAADPDILSIHVSEGLSGTINAAKAAAPLVPEANVTFWDSRTLSGALGWQVLAAANAVRAGWTKEQILAMLQKISDATDIIFTVDTLEYLIHGGRVSHIQGLVANLLNIKPVIHVDKSTGKYAQLGRARTIKKAAKTMVEEVLKKHPAGSRMRIQVGHGDAEDIAEMMKEELRANFDCNFVPTMRIAPVLAAHTGPTMVGFVYARESALADFPFSG